MLCIALLNPIILIHMQSKFLLSLWAAQAANAN